MMGLSAPVMAQEISYQDKLKPIENVLKTNAGDAKALKDLTKDYEKVFKKNPKALVALGELFAMNKKFTEAEAAANMAIAKDKSCGAAYILLGDIKAMQDSGGDAAMWYSQAMTMDPKNPDGYMRYANVYRKVDPDESAKALQKLKQIRPDFPVDAETGNSFYIGQNYEKAYEFFSKADKNQMSEYYLGNYDITDYYLHKYDEALELAKFGKNKFPKNTLFNRVAMWSAVDTQKFTEALGYAESVVNNDTLKKSARDYLYYGQALKGNGQFDKAIEQYQKAFAIDNTDFKPYQYIAEAYQAAGQEDKALEWSQKYMDNNQNATPSDFAKLANIYVAKAEKATTDKLTIMQKAFAIYDNMASKWPSISGWAFHQAGISATQVELHDQAAEYYKKAIDALKNTTDESEKATLISCLQNIGYYYAGIKNDLESAKPYYEMLIKLDPNDANAKAALGLNETTPTE